MPTLEELLWASLKGANEKFDQADQALHAAVAETAKAVEAVTKGKIQLRLTPDVDSEYFKRYLLIIATQSNIDFRNLTHFLVPKTGFPIERQEQLYSPSKGQMEFQSVEYFKSSEEIRAYFHRLASDQNSPLVGYLAYITRILT